MTFLQRLALCWRLLWAKPSHTIEHAKRELRLAFEPEPEYNILDRGLADFVTRDCLEILTVMGTQRHSGMGRYVMRDLIGRLCVHDVLSPLQDTPDDWQVISLGSENVLQHRRCGHVFRQIDGDTVITYDSEGKVFRDSEGGTYTSFESRVPVTFPYTPMRVYIDVPDLVPDEEQRA